MIIFLYKDRKYIEYRKGIVSKEYNASTGHLLPKAFCVLEYCQHNQHIDKFSKEYPTASVDLKLFTLHKLID